MGTFGKPWSIDDLTKHLKRNPAARVSKPAVKPPRKAVEAVNVAQALFAQGPAGNALYEAVTGNKPKGNRKVHNATKVEIDGIKFDSRLEAHVYSELQRHKIPHERQKEFLLIEKFQYQGKNIRPMVLTVDFWLPELNVILEAKGYGDEKWKVKLKLLKLVLKRDYNMEPDILLPSNKKEMDRVILEILSKTRK